MIDAVITVGLVLLIFVVLAAVYKWLFGNNPKFF
jgi:hypothetical protein